MFGTSIKAFSKLLYFSVNTFNRSQAVLIGDD